MCADLISTFKKSLLNRSQGPNHSLLPFMISSTFHNSPNKQFGVLATRHIDLLETFKGLAVEGIRPEEKLVTIDGDWYELPILGLEGSFLMFSEPGIKRQRLAEILKSVVVDIMADGNPPDLTILEQAKHSTFVNDLKKNIMIVDHGNSIKHYTRMAEKIANNAPTDLMGSSLRVNTYSMSLIRLPRKSDFYKGAGDDYMLIWRALRISMNEVIEELSTDGRFHKYKIHKDSQVSNNELSRIRLESSIYFNRNTPQKLIKGLLHNHTEEDAFRTFRELQRLTVAGGRDNERYKFFKLDIFASQRYFSEITTLRIGEIDASGIPETLPEFQVYEHYFVDSYWEGKYNFAVRIIRSASYNYNVLLQDLQKVFTYTKTLSVPGGRQFIEDLEVLRLNHVTRNSITAKEFKEAADRLDRGMIILANETKATGLRFRDPQVFWDKDFFKLLKKTKGIPKTLSFYQKHTPQIDYLERTRGIYHSALLIIKDPKLPIDTAIDGLIGVSKGVREGFNSRAINSGMIKGLTHMMLS